jgi:hypothetical protein
MAASAVMKNYRICSKHGHITVSADVYREVRDHLIKMEGSQIWAPMRDHTARLMDALQSLSRVMPDHFTQISLTRLN